MSRLSKVLGINTNFVSDKDEPLSKVYSNSSELIAKINKEGSGLKLDLKFSEMSIAQIKRMVNIQLIPKDKITGADNEQSPTDGLSYDAQVMYCDIISWILERKEADTEGELERNEAICDMTAQASEMVTDGLDALLDYYTTRREQEEKRLASEAVTKANDRKNKLEALYSELRQKDYSKDTGLVAKILKFRTDNKGWFVIAKMEKIRPYAAADKNTEIDRTGYIGSQEKAELSGINAYDCLAICHIHDDYPPVQFTTVAPLGKRHVLMVKGLIRKLENLLAENAVTMTERALTIFKLLMPATETAKGILSMLANDDMRELNRDADCTSTIPIIKDQTIAHIQSGKYLNGDTKVKVKDNTAET